MTNHRVPVIEAAGLMKQYGGFVAVNKINFTVHQGEFVGILGPNGAGKSTTMKMIYCASPVTGGTLKVTGLDVRTRARDVKRVIGVVPQEDNLDPDLPVRDNLMVYARYFGISRNVAAQRADEALELFQLTEKAREPVDSLSGGMKRRLIIARSLINAPQLVVLDEPTTGLDPQARHLVWQKLRQLRAQGATMLLTTHYMEEASQLCDRLMIMDRGDILSEGTPAELVERHVGHEVLELHTSLQPQAPVAAEVAGWGAEHEVTDDAIYVFGRNGHLPEPQSPVDRLIRRPASLEDVFLKLAGRSLEE